MSNTVTPVLVTGATGNVGREVVRALQSLDVPFVAAVSSAASARKALGDSVSIREIDLRDPRTYDAALAGVRGLFLLRPPPISNVRETLNVLVDRAIVAGVEHVAFLSVDGADRQRWIPHHKVEKHLLARGISATILRPGFFAQNLGDAYLDDIREHDQLYVPAGSGRVAFVDVRDVAELAARSFLDPALRGRGWSLTGPAAVTFHEVAEDLSATLGRTIRYRAASIPGYAAHLRHRGLPWMQVAVQTLLHAGLRLGNAENVDPALGQLLGRAPRRITDYINEHQLLWRSQPSA
jgi:uncharacterized protein YbjT (DUF2867 family)